MRTELTIEASAHRSPRIIAVGGLSARLTGPDSVHMIGTAATPLGGDNLCIRIVVGAGARLSVRSVAASVALPGRSAVESSAEWMFAVDDGGVLDFDPKPMIVAGNAIHHTHTAIDFSSSSTIEYRERVQIGRVGESLGKWYGTMRSDVDGRAHLRHRVELGVGTTGYDALATPLSLSSTLVYPDDRKPGSIGSSAVRMPLAAGGSLTTSTGITLQALPLVP
ncbi:urease accessory protein UreD [Rhodococcoides kyotonense]|uniref:Urease accessory protein n=1 Tax=Rhodococcoides kyotonense TaxID=398843 RepID=A0A239JQD5_9NOCA|nr:urease accessory protein UreD [Rhodococcus kyotonensis]SNT07752.1 urease accessory protein [Rhodococcus kyotonensis]